MMTSIKKNISYQVVYEVLVILLPLLTSPYVSRTIGAEGLGKYSYSYVIAYYFVLLSMLGIKNYGNREIARVREIKKNLNETFSNLLAVHLMFSVVCSFIYILYIISLGKQALYATIQGALVLSALFDISWFYFGLEKFKMTVTRDIIVKICTVICIFTFVQTSNDLWKYCFIMSVGTLLSQLSLWISLKKYVSLQKPQWGYMRQHIKPLVVLFIPVLSVSLYKYMDKIMIGALSDKVELGYYENAEKAINIPLSMISAFGTVMLPKMSNLAATKNKIASERYMSISMQFVMAVAFALAFGLSGVGTIFAPIFWGMEFAKCGQLIIGLAVTIPFIAFANIIRTQYLIPIQRDKEYLISVIIGAIINLIINSLLISKMGSYGAMIGTIAAEISVCFIQTIVVYRELPLKKYINSFIPFILVGIIMFGFVFILGRVLGIHIYTLLLQGTIGATFYCGCGCVILYKTKNEVFLGMSRKLKSKIYF